MTQLVLVTSQLLQFCPSFITMVAQLLQLLQFFITIDTIVLSHLVEACSSSLLPLAAARPVRVVATAAPRRGEGCSSRASPLVRVRQSVAVKALALCVVRMPTKIASRGLIPWCHTSSRPITPKPSNSLALLAVGYLPSFSRPRRRRRDAWVVLSRRPTRAIWHGAAMHGRFRYLLLYVHIPMYESGGAFWYSCVPRLLFGLSSSNVILIGYVIVQGGSFQVER